MASKIGARSAQLCSNDLCPTPGAPLTEAQLRDNRVHLAFPGYARKDAATLPFCDPCYAKFGTPQQEKP